MSELLVAILLLAMQAPEPDNATATVNGIVENSVTGQGVEGVTVEITPGRAHATTAADGSFTLRLPPGEYRVGFRKTGFIGTDYPSVRPRRQQLSGGENRVRLQIAPAANISGRVLGENNEPLPGVSVYARQGPGLSAIMDTTAADGSYRLEHLAPGSYAIEIRAPESLRKSKRVLADGIATTYAPLTWYPGVSEMAAASPVPVVAGLDLAGFDIRLRRSRIAALALIVADAVSKDAAAGVSVRLRARGDIDFAETRTDDTGRARFDWIAPGEYTAELTPVGNAQALPYTTTFSVAPPREEVRVALPGWTVLRARLVHDGRRDATAAVFIGPKAVEFRDDASEVLVPPGQWRVHAVALPFPRGMYISSATYGEHDALAEPIVTTEGAANPDLIVTVSEGARKIAGRVLDDRDQPVPGELVRATAPGRSAAAYTDDDGYFEIANLAPVEYALRAGQNCESPSVRADLKQSDVRLPSPLRSCAAPK